MATSVLIVDDDPDFRGLAERVLKASGLDVVAHANNIAAAMKAVETTKPDAALVDIDLPDGNGIALARDLTAPPWQLSVVLTSVDINAVQLADVHRSGVADFVPKADLPSAPLAQLLAPK